MKYSGNDSVVNWEYCHGNATTIEQTDKPFHRTAPSVLKQSAERKNERPMKVYGDLLESAGPNLKSQSVTAPRNLEQIKNAQKYARNKSKISHCGIFNAYEVGDETGFLQKMKIFPNLKICCMHSGTNITKYVFSAFHIQDTYIVYCMYNFTYIVYCFFIYFIHILYMKYISIFIYIYTQCTRSTLFHVYYRQFNYVISI